MDAWADFSNTSQTNKEWGGGGGWWGCVAGITALPAVEVDTGGGTHIERQTEGFEEELKTVARFLTHRARRSFSPITQGGFVKYHCEHEEW